MLLHFTFEGQLADGAVQFNEELRYLKVMLPAAENKYIHSRVFIEAGGELSEFSGTRRYFKFD